ncbi:MAG: membrane protein insertion efficiency factor YidD [Planctomycetaceae bacterium]|jgi:putative membrane protein insertion efficiency factor|nr:membrane protein insertion efficiency factor YidD [Planctomycetaceae bacterium]
MIGKFFASGIIVCVILYKRCISPFLPHVCRFEPSCSTYMIEAVKKYGVIRGLIKGIGRICRCNPFFPGGEDPP